MKVEFSRREFVGSLAAVPLAAHAAFGAQAPQSTPAASFPIIDTHIHLFDKTRPEGAPYPRDMPGGGEPPQGMIALPNRYQAIVSPFGVTGAIVVEASPRLEDNQWILDLAANAPIIVGLVGRIDPADAAFGKHLERFQKNKLFLGIRQGQLHLGLDKPDYMANLKRLADADCSLDIDTPSYGLAGPGTLLKVLDKVANLRVVLDHIPGISYRVKEYTDQAARAKFVADMKELGRRPNVYAKLSEVVRAVNGNVSTDLSTYKDWLDQMWDVFGEDRIMFGSDWPQSESLEYNSYPSVIGVARAYVATKGPSAMEKVFWKNSTKPYRWVQRNPSQRRA